MPLFAFTYLHVNCRWPIEPIPYHVRTMEKQSRRAFDLIPVLH